MTPITLTITPSCDDEGRPRPGRYDAAVGRTLVTSSTTPLLDAARVLAAEGVPPDTRLAMRHAGADHDALTSTVGAAARFRVQEGSSGKPVFRPWVPDGRWPVRWCESRAQRRNGAAAGCLPYRRLGTWLP
jgi:hypothetical protein